MRDPTNETLIFVHAPRTGGGTLERILDRQFRRRTPFTVEGDSAATVQASLARLESMDPAARRAIACLKGHVAFGVHRFLEQPVRYVTLVRDPVDRVVSHYFFTRSTPRHWLHRKVVEERLSLEDYVHLRMRQGMANYCTRVLSGCVDWEDLTRPGADLPADGPARARANLEAHFSVVGVTERFDESVLLMKEAYGWGSVRYVKDNVTPNKPQVPVTDRQREIILDYNALDAELHAFAKERLDRAIQDRPDFHRRLRRFRAANRWYAAVAGPVVALKRRFHRLKMSANASKYSP